MKSMTLLSACLLVVLGAGCMSTPDAMGDEAATAANRIMSGPADSGASDTEVDLTMGASYTGDVETKNVTAKSTVQRSNSQTAPIQTGVTSAGVNEESRAKRIAADPPLQILMRQIARLEQSESPDEEKIAEVTAAIAARMVEIDSSLAKGAGGDFSSLRSWVQVFTNVSLNGADGDVTEAHAEKIGGAIVGALGAVGGREGGP